MMVVLCSFTLLLEPEKDILGKWKIDESSIDGFFKGVVNQSRKTNEDMAQQMEDNADAVKEAIRNIEIDYKADHTYEVTTPQGPQGGKWELANNGHAILLTRDGGKQRRDSVMTLTPTQLRIINFERGDTTLYVRP